MLDTMDPPDEREARRPPDRKLSPEAEVLISGVDAAQLRI